MEETKGLSVERSPFTISNVEERVTNINNGVVIKTDKEITFTGRCAMERKRDIENDQISEYDERL